MSAALQGLSERIPLETLVFTIGRAPDNQLVLSDGKTSTHHAIIQMHKPNPLLFDLDSTNGTFVNDSRLVSRVPYPLRSGDIIRIGDTTYTFEQDDVEATERAVPPTVRQSDQSGYDPTVRPDTPGPASSFQQPIQQASPYAPLPPSGAVFPPAAPALPQGPFWSDATSPSLEQRPLAPSEVIFPPAAPASPQGSLWSSATSPNLDQGLLQSPPWGNVPGSAAIPPTSYSPGAAAPPFYGPPGYMQQPQNGKKTGGIPRLLLIIVAVVVVLGVIGGIIIYTLPRPAMTVSSAYKVGNVLAGANGTSLSVSGHKFSSSSAITFLLDGQPVSGSQPVRSDSSGNVSTNVQITGSWSLGRHTLTAKDASGYTTGQGVAIQVVAQGEANTPGPSGAPPDDASMAINAQVTSTMISTNNGGPINEILTVTGKPDPNGGTVCDNGLDNGQPHTSTSSSQGLTFQETITFSCSGSYKSGKLSYTETATSDTIQVSNGVTCTAHTPYTFQHLEGTFTSAASINGTYTSDAITADCNGGVGTLQTLADQGTWTGQAATSGPSGSQTT